MFFLSSWYADLLGWLQGHMLTCPLKKMFHIDCPGCGMQRSFLALLNGDMYTSWMFYPPTIPMLSLLAFTLLHVKYRFVHGASIIKYLQLTIGIMIFVFYVYKIFNHKITA